jgi:flavin reductase (DIM6/NTAB) family NADH-FMN oxidoreductase RutF
MRDILPALPPSIEPSTQTSRAFRDVLGCFATGVTLVTIQGPDGPMGFIANSFSSISMEPPLILWAPAKSAARYPYYAAAKHFAIHILAADQGALVEHFHRGTGSFDAFTYSINAQGVPLLDEALARFECEQYATHDGGDHLIVVGRVLAASSQAGTPLVFAQGHFSEITPRHLLKE